MKLSCVLSLEAVIVSHLYGPIARTLYHFNQVLIGTVLGITETAMEELIELAYSIHKSIM